MVGAFNEYNLIRSLDIDLVKLIQMIAGYNIVLLPSSNYY